MVWLIREDVAHEMKRARDARSRPSAEIEAEFDGVIAARSDKGPRNLSVAGNVAEIRVEGVLTKQPDFWLWLLGYGNTAYADIQEALALADSDPSVEKIVLHVDSPGGNVDGLFETLAAIESVSKPVECITSQACSAAYAIASQAERIDATNIAAVIGSIGVVATFLVDEDVVTITSTEAPDKRPDIKTEEGQAVIRKHLDDIHEVFADAIARGRDTTVKKVNSEFGRGSVFLADEARRRGMIDGIRGARPELKVVRGELGPASPKSTADGGGVHPMKRKPMNEEELRAQHPELYQAVLNTGREQGRTEALEEERDRVEAHLHAGEQCGDMAIAIEAIRNGATMTQSLVTKYMFASRNKAESDAYTQQTAEAGAAADGAAPQSKPTTRTPADELASMLDDEGNVKEG